MAALAVVVAALLAISTMAAPPPQLHEAAPRVTEPGRVLTLHGRFFGADRATGAVTFAGREPRIGAYRSWSDRRIVVVVPASFESGLVRVVTRAGKSGALLLTDRGDLPKPVAGERLPGGPPVITSIRPAAAAVGDAVTISGAGFGSAAAGAAVRFAAVAGAAGFAAPPDAAESGPVLVETSDVDLDHVRWSDRRIVVRVPAGARSGAVSVRTAAGMSAARGFQVRRSAVGTIRYADPRSYAVTYVVAVDRVSAAGGNGLYLWIPEIPATPAQRHESEPAANAQPVYRLPAGVGLFHLHDLAAGASHEVRRRYRVRRYAIRTEIEPSNVRAYRAGDRFYARFTGGDALVPSGGRLPGVAERAVRGYVNPWWRARMVFDYVVDRLQPDSAEGARAAPAGAEPMNVVMAAIDRRRGAAYEYAVTFSAVARAAGVPARPVAGYLIDEGGRAAPHYWAEFYLQDFGWAPVDPAASDGAALLPPSGGGEAGRSFFGAVDSRRIVLAKGVADPPPIARGRRVRHAHVTGLQTAHEDAVGALRGYRARWQELTVTERIR